MDLPEYRKICSCIYCIASNDWCEQHIFLNPEDYYFDDYWRFLGKSARLKIYVAPSRWKIDACTGTYNSRLFQKRHEEQEALVRASKLDNGVVTKKRTREVNYFSSTITPSIS